MVLKTPRYRLETDVRLAAWTTFGVGGPARSMVTCDNADALEAALADIRAADAPSFVLGGGSNVLVADEGFAGTVIRYRAAGFDILGTDAGRTRIRAEAGLRWDALVARTVDLGLGGIEALSGIPGAVGAAPIQNIGAYGQELGETLVAVEVVDRGNGERRRLEATDCGLGYRTSRFKTDWRDRDVIVAVELDLTLGASGAVRYAGLRQYLDAHTDKRAEPTPMDVRRAVLAVRAEKSMVLDAKDPNRRSAGSFFTNPVVSVADADAVTVAARRAGVDRDMPRWPQSAGRVKLSAAWLIESAGFERGARYGRAGLSTRHVLALINPGDASARDLVALAARIRARVKARFAVVLEPEPVWLGFAHDVSTLLEHPDLLDPPSATHDLNPPLEDAKP